MTRTTLKDRLTMVRDETIESTGAGFGFGTIGGSILGPLAGGIVAGLGYLVDPSIPTDIINLVNSSYESQGLGLDSIITGGAIYFGTPVAGAALGFAGGLKSGLYHAMKGDSNYMQWHKRGRRENEIKQFIIDP